VDTLTSTSIINEARNCGQRMKNAMFNALLIVTGSFLSPWAAIKWSEVGFRVEPKFYAGNRDGSLFLIAALIGVALFSYGLFNILVLCRK
jgi:hypothetical protein